jgi:hypothetical protein
MALTDKLTAIGDAIRVQSGKTELIPLAQMPDEIINLQSLNFEIVGNPKPNNPKEGTVWIDTDEEITGWIFSPTEPTAEDGKVWISFGIGGEVSFNALKKNGIVLYITEAHQYISGAWVKKTAKIYQGGEWKNLIVLLFNNGDQAEDITGGWGFDNGYANGGCTGSVGNTLKMNAITPGSSTGNYYAGMKTNKVFPTNGATTLNIHFVSISAKNGNSGNPAFFVSNVAGGDVDNFLVSYTNLEKTDWTLSIDISKISNIRPYIGSHPWYSLSSNCAMEIDKVWFA